jgi:hypothetical protein
LKLAEVAVIIVVVGSGFVSQRIQDALAAAALSVCRSRIPIDLEND